MAVEFTTPTGYQESHVETTCLTDPHDITAFTVPADTDVLVVAVTHWSGSSTSFYEGAGSITWDQGGSNQALTQAVKAISNGVNHAELYYVVNPTPGNQTLRLDPTGTNPETQSVTAIYLKGVDTSNPIVSTDTDAAQFPTATPAGFSSGDMALGVVYSYDSGASLSGSITTGTELVSGELTGTIQCSDQNEFIVAYNDASATIAQGINGRNKSLAVALFRAAPSTNAFILEITTTTADETVVIPGTGSGYSYDIDWGDGNSDLSQTTSAPSHVYASAGTYQVAISGTFPRVFYANGAYASQLTGIVQWGDENTWGTDQEAAFYGCSNLTGSLPNTLGPFDGLTNSAYMFFNTSISGSLPSEMTLASLTNGTYMFYNTSISGSLPSSMTLASLTNGLAMFYNTSISGSLPSGMTLTNLTAGSSMFAETSISGALPSNMTLANLTTGDYMFYNTSISGALPSGMTLASLTDGTLMFFGTSITPVFYSHLLEAMEANNSNNNVTFHAGTADYWSGDAATARAALVGRGWTFTDGSEDTDVDWTDDDYEITGNFDISGDAALVWPVGTGTITLTGPASQSINFDGETIEDLVINKASGTATLTGNLTTDSVTCTSGTLDVNGNTITIPTGGSMTVDAGCSVID